MPEDRVAGVTPGRPIEPAAARQGVKSVEIAGRVLRALVACQMKVSLKELSQAVGLPPAKLHRYLVSLICIELVAQDPETRKYQLGRFASELGFSAMRASDPLDEAMRLQTRLRDELDETVTLAVWSPEGPLITHVEEARRSDVMTVRTGTHLPMLGTASGIVFAGFMPPSATLPLVRRELAQVEADNADPIATSERELMQLAALARERKWVVNKGHLLSGVVAIATPLLNRTGNIYAVLAVVVGRSNRFTPERESQIIERLLRIAGHRP